MRTEIKISIEAIEDDGYHILVPVFINGYLQNLVLDTGASKTILNLELVENLIENLEQVPPENARTAGVTDNEILPFTGILNEFKIGDIVISDKKFMILDLSHVNKIYREILNKEVAGLLGSDLLMEFNAIIDYKRKKLILSGEN